MAFLTFRYLILYSIYYIIHIVINVCNSATS